MPLPNVRFFVVYSNAPLYVDKSHNLTSSMTYLLHLEHQNWSTHFHKVLKIFFLAIMRLYEFQWILSEKLETNSHHQKQCADVGTMQKFTDSIIHHKNDLNSLDRTEGNKYENRVRLFIRNWIFNLKAKWKSDLSRWLWTRAFLQSEVSKYPLNHYLKKAM